jgi:flavin-dependent dehydrogenase
MNSNSQQCDVLIIGGGLAGLVNAILLSRNGFKVILLEKKSYPFHKVCGEYVSNEVLEFLRSIGFDPFEYGASSVTNFRMSSEGGAELRANLDMGGFGLSRYLMDHALAKLAAESGATVVENCRVQNIRFDGKFFQIATSSVNYTTQLVIASHGKRDIIDKKLERPFIETHTGYMGVKYHIRTNYAKDEVGLFHFHGGYCGIVKIEHDKYNLCYLYRRSENFRFHEIGELEEKVLYKNAVLREIFTSADFIEKTPLVINELYFQKKTCIQDHILFCGDSAGLITPLCGNGMSMAIHGAALLSEIIVKNLNPGFQLDGNSRSLIESAYEDAWRKAFSKRLFIGRQLQKLSGKSVLTSAMIRTMNGFPFVKRAVIKSTHGKNVPAFSPKSDHQFYQTSRL